MINRRAYMKLPLLLVAALLMVACTSVAPTPPAQQPTSRPLPEGIAIRPGPDDESVAILPETEEGEGNWQVGQAQQYTLGHCGLASPIDFDGNLWDPTGGHNGNGQEPSPEQVTELLGETTVSIMMISPLSAVLTAPLGTVVFLDRVPGAKAYLLCD
jgi:hypothetical protein